MEQELLAVIGNLYVESLKTQQYLTQLQNMMADKDRQIQDLTVKLNRTVIESSK